MSFRPKRVLVPVDLATPSGHRLAELAIEAAADLTSAFGAKTVVVTVLHKDDALGGDPASEMSIFLDPHRGRVDLVATDVLIADDAGTAIAAAAAEHEADTIVMSTHGRQGVSRVLLGSVAEKVLQHTRATVLVLQHAGEPSTL